MIKVTIVIGEKLYCILNLYFLIITLIKNEAIMLRIEKQDLLKWFADGAKPRENWKIGTEHEKFVFHIDNLERVGYFGKSGISDLLNKLARENIGRKY